MPKLLLFAAILLLVGPVAAQPTTSALQKIGFIAAGFPGRTTEAFRSGLSDAGYVEGKHFVLEARYAEGKQERVADLVAEVLRRNVDVLVVSSTVTALAAKRATPTVPIVFASVFDPVGSGIVPRLARPGGNITGASIAVGGSGSAGKWLELAKEALPGASRVAVLWNRVNPASAQSVADLRAAARALHVAIELHDAASGAELDRALARIRARPVEAMIVTNDPLFTAHREKLVEFTAAARLPTVYFFRTFVDAGGLMSYGGSQEESHRRAAALVVRIFKGAKPGDLSIEQPTRMELAINLRTARALGLTIPNSLLLRADEIVE